MDQPDSWHGIPSVGTSGQGLDRECESGHGDEDLEQQDRTFRVISLGMDDERDLQSSPTIECVELKTRKNSMTLWNRNVSIFSRQDASLAPSPTFVESFAAINDAFKEILGLPEQFVLSQLQLPSSKIFIMRCERWLSLQSVQLYRLHVETYLSETKLTLLMTLASLGALDLIRSFFARFGARSINFQNKEGNTALHCAAYHGHLHVSHCLVQNGASIGMTNSANETAAHMAYRTNRIELISYFKAAANQQQSARLSRPNHPVSIVLKKTHVTTFFGQGLGYHSVGNSPFVGSDESRVNSPICFNDEPLVSNFGIAKLATARRSVDPRAKLHVN